MGKIKNIILYSLVIIMMIALVFYFKFVFLNNDLLTGNNTSNQVEDGLVGESAVMGTEGEPLLSEISEKETNGIKYKVFSKMESEENGKEIILYDVVTSDIKEEKLRILTEKIIKEIPNEEKTEKIVLFFHKDESLLGVEFHAQAIWVSGEIFIEIAQEN